LCGLLLKWFRLQKDETQKSGGARLGSDGRERRSRTGEPKSSKKEGIRKSKELPRQKGGRSGRGKTLIDGGGKNVVPSYLVETPGGRVIDPRNLGKAGNQPLKKGALRLKRNRARAKTCQGLNEEKDQGTQLRSVTGKKEK